MIIQKKLFPSQEKGENVFLLIRKHWFNYIIFFLLDLLMFVPVIVLIIYSISNPDFFGSDVFIFLIAILTVFILTILATQLYGFVDYYLDVYIVTNERIVDICQDGLFKRKISELHLRQVQDVSADVTGIWGTLLRFGDVQIQTAAERENFIFKSVPQPYNVAKQILDLHEDYIERLSKTAKTKKYQGEDYVENDEDTLPYREMDLQEHEAKVVPNSIKTAVSEEGQLQEGKETVL